MQLFVGTSGYSFKEWKGAIYPEKLPDKQMLGHYAQIFSTVEINATFHRFPAAAVVENWAAQVPDGFRFSLKARQTITHFRRLQNAESQIDDFVNLASLLKSRQGPVLFQLPPNFKKDVPRLDAFLTYLNQRAAAVMEFRHESWFADDVYECLRKHACALCASDEIDDIKPTLVDTSSFCYVRFRDERYTDKALSKWIDKMKSHKWDAAYVYFKHEDVGGGPRLAKRFMELSAK